jgi:hypothetical protein
MAKEDRDEDELPWARPAFMVAAAFLVVVLGLGVWLVTKGHKDEPSASGTSSVVTSTTRPPRSSTTSVPAARPSTSGAAKKRDSTCDLSSSDQTVPTVAPSGITWQLWDGIALPFSKTAGPEVVTGDIARCYAHTPVGALLAGVQIQYRFLLSSHWKAIAEKQLMPGPGRDALLRVAAQAAATSTPPAPDGTYAQVAGYLFVTYTPQTAVIDIVTRSDAGAFQEAAVTVDWSDDDWKVAVQPTGQFTTPAEPLSSIAGYVMWGGV